MFINDNKDNLYNFFYCRYGKCCLSCFSCRKDKKSCCEG